MKTMKIILGIILVIIGGYSAIHPGMTFLGIGWMLGPVFLIMGIQSILLYIQRKKTEKRPVWELLLGILNILLGLVLLYNVMSRAIADLVIVYMIGLWIVASGVLRLTIALKLEETSSKVLGIIVGVICIIAGVYAFFHPFIAAMSTGYMIAFSVIFGGINLLISAFTKDNI